MVMAKDEQTEDAPIAADTDGWIKVAAAMQAVVAQLTPDAVAPFLPMQAVISVAAHEVIISDAAGDVVIAK